MRAYMDANARVFTQRGVVLWAAVSVYQGRRKELGTVQRIARTGAWGWKELGTRQRHLETHELAPVACRDALSAIAMNKCGDLSLREERVRNRIGDASARSLDQENLGAEQIIGIHLEWYLSVCSLARVAAFAVFVWLWLIFIEVYMALSSGPPFSIASSTYSLHILFFCCHLVVSSKHERENYERKYQIMVEVWAWERNELGIG